MKTKEDVILDILNEQPSIFIQLLQHDRKGLARTISRILDAVSHKKREEKKREMEERIDAIEVRLGMSEGTYDY